MRLRSVAISLLAIVLLSTLDACAPVRVNEGWQGLGRRWFDAEVLTGFDGAGAMVATLSVSIPLRNLVFFRTEDDTYEAGYTFDVVQRHQGQPLKTNRFSGVVSVPTYEESREALVERRTVRLELADVPERGQEPIELMVRVQVEGTERTNRMLLTVTPETMAEGGVALGEITLYQRRNPLGPPLETTVEVMPRGIPDANLFARSSFGAFDVATGAPWVLIRVFDLTPEQDVGTHDLRLEVAGTDVSEHRWTQQIPVGKQGAETAVLLELPVDALAHGSNRLAVSLPAAKRRGIDLQNYGLDVADDRSWRAIIRQVDLLANRQELSELREAPAEERARRWSEFWARRNRGGGDDNDRLREHYRRVAHARRHYADGVSDGALSDRGRVFVLHGRPSSIRTSSDQLQASGAWEVWNYNDLRLVYYFQLVFGANYRLVWREEF